MMKGVFPPRPNSQVCAFLPSFFCFCQVYSSPFFFVISSLHVCTCVSPLQQSPFICMPIFVLCKNFERLGVAADVGMLSAVAPATPIAPVSIIPTAPVSAIPSVLVSTYLLYLFLPHLQPLFSQVLVSFSSPPLFLSHEFIVPLSWFLMLRFMLLVRSVAYCHFSV